MPCVKTGFRVFVLQNMSKNSKKFRFFIFKAFCILLGAIGSLNPAKAGTTWTCFLGLHALVKASSSPGEIKVHTPKSRSAWAQDSGTLGVVTGILLDDLP